MKGKGHKIQIDGFNPDVAVQGLNGYRTFTIVKPEHGHFPTANELTDRIANLYSDSDGHVGKVVLVGEQKKE